MNPYTTIFRLAVGAAAGVLVISWNEQRHTIARLNDDLGVLFGITPDPDSAAVVWEADSVGVSWPGAIR